MKITPTTRVALGATGVLAALSAAAPQAARAATLDAPLTQTLAARQKAGVTAVIARTNGPLTTADRARLTALGVDITRRLPIIHSIALRVPTRHLATLAALPFVTHLSADGLTKKCDEFTVGSSGAGAAFAQYGLNGTGVTVAVIDSGVGGTGLTKTARDLIRDTSGANTRLLAATNFCPDESILYDDSGHGSHVAGIVAGNGYSSYGSLYYRTFYGIARNANLVSVKVLNGSGQGSVSQVISGLQWTVANKAKYNIRVINLSLGHPVGESYTTDPLCQAVEAAWKAGIVVVCAAGNEGRLNTANTAGLDNEGWGSNYGSIASPGNDPYVITVGATKNMDGNRADDRIATYSSRGPSRLDFVLKPDLIAPGNKVISVFSKNTNLAQFSSNIMPTSMYVKTVTSGTTSNAYFCLSGTSMASPVVAGAAALMLQATPNLTPDTVKARLMASADKWADPNGNGDACTYGAGYLNIPAALISTLTVTGEYAVSPSLSLDSRGNLYVNDDHAIWGKTGVSSQHAIWGKDLLWGVMGDLHAIWGKNALTSSATVAADTSLMGPNVVTDNHAIWGKSVWSDHSVWGATSSAVDLSSTAINGE